jgi:hypothetical protein
MKTNVVNTIVGDNSASFKSCPADGKGAGTALRRCIPHTSPDEWSVLADDVAESAGTSRHGLSGGTARQGSTASAAIYLRFVDQLQATRVLLPFSSPHFVFGQSCGIRLVVGDVWPALESEEDSGLERLGQKS